jgi:adenylate cyclase class IV
MRTLEARGKIRDIEEAIDMAKKIGGIFKGSYRATDIIFKSKKEDEEGVIDLRIFELNNRQGKNYIFVHKIAEWSDKIKKDKIILKGEFDTMGEVLDFIADHYGDSLKEHYEYSREGWEYNVGKSDIFIENIEKLGPTIEIEADNKSDLENLFKLFEVEKRFSESTPEIMRKLLGKNN